MAQRRQRGWLKKETRTQGETWVLYFRTTRKFDGRRVENKIPIGFLRDFPDKSSAWAEVERLYLALNPVDSRRGVTFADLAQHHAEHELVDRSRIHTPQSAYHNKRLRESPPESFATKVWLENRAEYTTTGNRAMADDLERGEGLENPTLDRMRRLMSMVYRHGQRYGLISRSTRVEPDALRSLQDDQRIRSDDHNS
jgi:hypothetical protein